MERNVKVLAKAGFSVRAIVSDNHSSNATTTIDRLHITHNIFQMIRNIFNIRHCSSHEEHMKQSSTTTIDRRSFE